MGMLSDLIAVELPLTNIRVRVSVAVLNLDYENLDRGLIPNIMVKKTAKDYEKRIDKELEIIKELIAKN